MKNIDSEQLQEEELAIKKKDSVNTNAFLTSDF
jgi:hypothetical protein